jgi:hypothetical protein
MRIQPRLLAALLMCVPGVAAAQESAQALPAVTAKNLLQGSLGFGSPVGALGLSYIYLPVRQAELEIGGGIGFTGYQISAMPKLSLGRNDRLLIGLGPSVSIDTSDQPKQSCVGYWLNGEIGYRHSTPAGLSVLAAVGVGYGLSGTIHTRCGGDCGSSVSDESVAGRWVPEARIAVGRSF